MNVYAATFSNKFFYSVMHVTAPDAESAKALFLTEVQSESTKRVAQEEREMWTAELGEYPGDDAYVYTFDGTVESVAEGVPSVAVPTVEMIRSGANG